jgi:excisionase family DNA binding protein
MSDLTTREAAQFLGVNAATVSNWRSRGVGPVFRKIGRLVRYRKADLEKYLRSRPDLALYASQR